MVKLKRLKIERYRDVEPCELRFSDRFNVLLGPNGAGKTTLLELISKVLRTNLAEPGDPFWLEVELEFEGSSLAGTVKTVTGPDVVPLHLKGDLSASLASRSAGAPASSWPDLDLRWRGRDPATLTRIHGNSDSIVIKRDGDPRELKRPLHEVEYFLRHDLLSTLTVLAQPLSQNTSMERLRNVARFDESLDTYRALTARQGDPVLVGQFLRPLIEATWMLEPQDSARQPKSMFAIEGMVPASMLRLMSDLFSGRAADIMLDNAGLENAGAAFLSMVARLLPRPPATPSPPPSDPPS